MVALVAILFSLFWCEGTSAQTNTSSTNVISAAGVYKCQTSPGFIYPGTDTITLSKNGTFRYDMSLSRGKMAAFVGTWSQSGNEVIAVLNERFLEGKPYPAADPNGWKPGSKMTMHVEGDKLFKSKVSNEPFTKVE